eukprot:g3641.t1
MTDCIYASDEYRNWKERRRILLDTGMLEHPSILAAEKTTWTVSSSDLQAVESWSAAGDIPTRPAMPSVVGSPTRKGAFLDAQREHTEQTLLKCLDRLSSDDQE